MNRAAIYGNLYMVKWLHLNKKKNNIKSALKYAIKYNRIKVIEYLKSIDPTIKPFSIYNGDDECGICLINELDRITCFSCKKPFHLECVRHWLKNNNRCPLCKDLMLISN